MKKDMVRIQKARQRYMIPGGASYQYRTLNAIHISPSNSIKHELAKSLGGYMIRKWGDVVIDTVISDLLKKIETHSKMLMEEFPLIKGHFITEAIPKVDKDRRVDLVRLNDEQWFEFETNKKVKKEDSYTFYI